VAAASKTHVEHAAAEGFEFRFRMPDGQTLVVPSLDMSVASDSEQLRGVTLALRVAYEVYELIDEAALFHLEPEHRGKHGNVWFDNTRDVELDVGLSATLVERLGDTVGTTADAAVFEFIRMAEQAGPDEPVLDCANWYALNVKQDQGGGLKTGYATTWAKADRLGD